MIVRRQSVGERVFFLLLYYMVSVLGFDYGIRFLAVSLHATDHVAGWNIEWFTIPTIFAFLLLLIGYLLHRIFATVVSETE
jgi:hypothetical protein